MGHPTAFLIFDFGLNELRFCQQVSSRGVLRTPARPRAAGPTHIRTIWNQKSKTRSHRHNLKSKIKNRKSKIEIQKSKIKNRKS